LAPAVAQIHRRLKERFDPHGIFNPGRLIADS
jgi:glycolate oxidase FAD binding subunit